MNLIKVALLLGIAFMCSTAFIGGNLMKVENERMTLKLIRIIKIGLLMSIVAMSLAMMLDLFLRASSPSSLPLW